MPSRAPRWGRRLLITVAVVAVCAGGAEVALRIITPNVIASEVRDAANLPSERPVEVTLGGSALLAALKGTVGEVTVRVPEMPLIAGVVGDVSAEARSVPFDVASGDLQDASASVSIGADQLGKVAAFVTDGFVDDAGVVGGDLAVSRSLSFWGMEISLEAVLGLSVDSGQISVTPVSASVGDALLTVEQVRSATGSLLDGVLAPQQVCVADQLPAGATLSDIQLHDAGEVVVTANLSETLLSDPAQLAYGRCER